MRSTVFFGFLSALVICAKSLNSKTGANVVPNKFIIEVEHTSGLDRRVDVIHPLDAVYHQIKSRDIRHQVVKEFKMDGIFHGAVLDVMNAEDVNLIKITPGVKAVRPVAILSVPRLAKYHLWNRADSPPDTLASHILTGVDKVHAEGNIGKGVKIGIIDSGIDYNHPALGSGFGPSKKFVIGYDFVGDDFTKPKPGPNPMDCNGHGTHVAGIIAAQPGNPYNISGVAYGATFGAYKVFDCDGQTSEDIIIEALGQAVKDGMDILTLSLGFYGHTGWASTTAAIVVDGIVQRGKIITVATGNDGDSGAWYASSPATGRDVISVGSVDNTDTVIPFQDAIVHGVEHPPIAYYSSLPLNISGSLPIYAISTNTSIVNDTCSPLAQDTPDLSKYLVVIRRETCDFLTNLNNATAKGAKVIFIYDNGIEFTKIPIGNTGNYTTALIQAADGEFLVEQFVSGASITLSFPQVGGATNFPNDHGGLMSDFSSYGPTFDFGFKPSFAAPGGNIVSTYPVAKGSYAVLSGTSMSTPFAAGAAALLLSAMPKSLSSPNDTRTLLETTSTKLLFEKAHPEYETLIKAGAGLINVYNAIHATTIVSPGELILNDSAHFQGNHTITIRNIGDTAKNYTLKHVPALTALTMKANSILPALGPLPISVTTATVGIEPVNFTVQAGAIQQVTISVTLPTTLDARYPVYSGFVEVTSGSENYHVSYIGLGASLKDHQIFDTTTEVVNFTLPALCDQNGYVTKMTNYSFFGKDFPIVSWRLAMGTPVLDIDLLDADGNFTGHLYSTDHLPRNNEEPEFSFNNYGLEKPLFMNGTQIPDGSYRIGIRVLRITGDPSLEGDYEWWESPVFGVHVLSLM